MSQAPTHTAPTSVQHTTTESDPERSKWVDIAEELGRKFARDAERNDREGRFVAAHYDDLRTAGLISFAVPVELGGGGATYSEVAETLRTLARFCPSTALALSMHTHLVCASVFKWTKGMPEEALLRRIVDEDLVLISTGAGDWIDSNGSVIKVSGGYRVTATKTFASGSMIGDVFVTTGRYEDPQEGIQVLHFPVARTAEGVTIGNDWDTLGMRATGSQTVRFEDVFVPEDKVALRRAPGSWHPAYNVVVGVAMPLIMSVYRGIAERARDLAFESAPDESDSYLQSRYGALESDALELGILVDDMIHTVAEYAFQPTVDTANRTLIAKSRAADLAKETVAKSMELVGGRAFFRSHELERLFRDIQAGAYHPLPRAKQVLFTGRHALGLDPHGA